MSVGGVFSIGSAARLLRVPVATIRTWEKRYGSVVPARTQGGHRLYTRDQLEQLRFIVERVSEGMRPGDAHRLLNASRSTRRLELELEPNAEAPMAARHAVDDFVVGLSEEQRFNLRLLVSELVANGVRHGAAARVRLAVRAAADRVRVEVSDDGDGFDWNGDRDDDDHGGRGLPLVAALADRWGLTFDRGTTAWFELLIAMHSNAD